MFDFLSGLTLAGALAIVGSVGTIVLGVFGYLLKVRSDSAKASTATSSPLKVLVDQHSVEISKVHSRVSSVKDDVSGVRELISTALSEVKVLEGLVRNLEKQMADHETRDIEDFKEVNAKTDKLMDILVRILQDDKL